MAQQIEREVRDFTRTSSKQVRSTIVVGGTNMGEQRGDLRSGVEIVVATPGRFIDHLRQVLAPSCQLCAGTAPDRVLPQLICLQHAHAMVRGSKEEIHSSI